MATSKNSVVISLTVSRERYEKFKSFYPKLDKPFLRRSLNLAIESREFFDSVFFNPIATKFEKEI